MGLAWGDVQNVQGETQGCYWDDLTGEPLDPVLVQAGRKLEMEYCESYPVWIPVPIEECWEMTGKGPIGSKWVDINKGDKVNPDIRCRLVATEVRIHKREDLFAATPPLEAVKSWLRCWQLPRGSIK